MIKSFMRSPSIAEMNYLQYRRPLKKLLKKLSKIITKIRIKKCKQSRHAHSKNLQIKNSAEESPLQ